MRRLIQSASQTPDEASSKAFFADVHLKAHAKEKGGVKGGRGNFLGRCGIASRASEEQDTLSSRGSRPCWQSTGKGRGARDGGQVRGYSGRRCITSQRFCCATLSDKEGSLRFLQVEADVVAGGELCEVIG